MEEACSQNTFKPNPLSSENQSSMTRIQPRFNIDRILQNCPYQITLKWLTTMYKENKWHTPLSTSTHFGEMAPWDSKKYSPVNKKNQH